MLPPPGCHPTPFVPVRPRFSTILCKFAHKIFSPGVTLPLVTPLHSATVNHTFRKEGGDGEAESHNRERKEHQKHECDGRVSMSYDCSTTADVDVEEYGHDYYRDEHKDGKLEVPRCPV